MYDAWRVKDDRNGDGQPRLNCTNRVISRGEEEEDRYDPDDTKEQWPEKDPVGRVTRPCVLKATGAIAGPGEGEYA